MMSREEIDRKIAEIRARANFDPDLWDACQRAIESLEAMYAGWQEEEDAASARDNNDL
jgi:hypothetical protein